MQVFKSSSDTNNIRDNVHKHDFWVWLRQVLICIIAPLDRGPMNCHIMEVPDVSMDVHDRFL